MCYDINEYDPFEPIFIIDWDGSPIFDNEPMTVDDWEQFLETMENENEA